MTPEKVDELMGLYVEHSARCEFLEREIRMLKRSLTVAMAEMVDDEVSLSQELTGMPHGSGTSDPTAILGIKLAEGHVSWTVEQIEKEIAGMEKELEQKRWTVVFVQAWMKCLNERERLLVEHKVLRKESWSEIGAAYTERYAIVLSKTGMKNIIERAMDKVYTVAS